jgi:hypothetical protein
VALVMAEHHLSERDACRLLEVDRSTCRYEPRPDRNAKLRKALHEAAERHRRFGYRRLRVMLTTREGWKVSIGRVHRLCRQEGLAVPRQKRKRIRGSVPVNPPVTISGMGSGLRFRRACQRTSAAGADDGGQLHPGVSGNRSRRGNVGRAGHQNAGEGD